MSGLPAPLIWGSGLGGIDRYRVAGRVLVHVGSAMTNPLAPAVHWHSNVQLQLAHLEGSRVRVAHQIPDKSAIFADPFCARAIRNARRLHDRVVRAHVVDDANEAVVQDRQASAENGIEIRHSRTLSGIEVGVRILTRRGGRLAAGHERAPRLIDTSSGIPNSRNATFLMEPTLGSAHSPPSRFRR